MLRAIHTAATGMEASQTNLDNIANNLANANTDAYKSSSAHFHDLFYQTIREPGSVSGPDTVTPTGVQVGVGSKTASVSKDFRMGPLIITNRDLDVAINGDGFFAVEAANGETLYTRDGHFQKGPDGRIMTIHGHVVQPSITIPKEAVSLAINPNGIVSIVDSKGKKSDIGQMELVSFVNAPGLKALGEGLYQLSEASGTPIQGKPTESNLGALQAGAKEGSNVNPVKEMVDMIQAQRAYEMSSKIIQSADSMLGTTTNILR